MTEVVEDFGSSSPKSEDTQPGTAKTVADILTAAADLIEPEGRWIKRANARLRPRGPEREPCDRDAGCFCAVGAIWRASGQTSYAASASAAVQQVERELGLKWPSQLTSWNDRRARTQAEVVAALRAAAEKARTASAVGTTEGREPQPPTTREGADR